ncbi:hypothetical protein [Streptomyces sp. NPDC055642]
MARYRGRLCMAVDLRQYSRHTYTGQADAQVRLRLVVEHAMRRARILRVRTQQQLQGDGRLLVFPARTDVVRAVPELILGLRDGLYEANRTPGAFGRMRMRAALAQGSVSRGESGYLGDCVVLVSRLVDSEELRGALERNEHSDLALAVPDELHRDVILRQSRGLPAPDFRRSEVIIEKKAFAVGAWLYAPRSAPARDPSPEPVIWGHSPRRAALREYVVPALGAAHLAATVVAHSQVLREWAVPGSAVTGRQADDFDGPDGAGEDPHGTGHPDTQAQAPHGPDIHHPDVSRDDVYHDDASHQGAHPSGGHDPGPYPSAGPYDPDPYHPDPSHPDPHVPGSYDPDPHHQDSGPHIDHMGHVDHFDHFDHFDHGGH